MARLDFRSVESALSGCCWSKHILTYETIGSTMDRARELAHKGAPEGTLIVAAQQTEGRGRLSRGWLSPVGSLSLSVLLYPLVEKLPYLTMLAGLAAAEAVEAVTPLRAGLKWPNDVFIHGKKVGGVLIESGVSRGRHFAVIGIGINVDLEMGLYPEIAGFATSLSDEAGAEVDGLKLLRAIVDNIEERYACFDGAAILVSWKNRLITLGQLVVARAGGEVIEGQAVDVTADGALVIRQNDGLVRTLIAGDVTLR